MGSSLNDTVTAFCKLYGIGVNDQNVLRQALKKRVRDPDPLLLFLGIIVPSGERKILSISDGMYECLCLLIVVYMCLFIYFYLFLNVVFGGHCAFGREKSNEYFGR